MYSSRSFRPLLIFLYLASVIFAASPISFCKCTCNANSTIIALNPGASPDSRTGLTCNDCNRQFCLDYNLPICKDVEEDKILTTCFQRDSTKDQAVVYTFIVLTVGLLIYAAVKPWLERRSALSAEGREYAPLQTDRI